MHLITTILIFVLSFFVSVSIVNAQDLGKSIEARSQQMAKAIADEDTKGLLKLFEDDAALLPEYHVTLYGSQHIKNYYRQFFEHAETLEYSKTPFEIESINKGYYIELGTFEHRYITASKNTFEYKGKYTTYWQVAKKGPTAIAHIWGSSSYFDAGMVDFISINVTPRQTMEPQTEWEKALEEHQAYAYNAVFAGDAEAQLITYHEDVVYMTYYDPPFIGKKQVAAYFRSHYNPESPMDSLQTRIVKVIDMGGHALRFGEYYVAWTWEEKPYDIKGKGLTLLKKIDNGSIQIYRQMINHSMPAALKEF